MPIELIVGEDYYVLTSTQHSAIHEIYGDTGCPFQLGPDGYYYCLASAISEDSDLYDYLMEYEWLNSIHYSKSNKPGGGM